MRSLQEVISPALRNKQLELGRNLLLPSLHFSVVTGTPIVGRTWEKVAHGDPQAMQIDLGTLGTCMGRTTVRASICMMRRGRRH